MSAKQNRLKSYVSTATAFVFALLAYTNCSRAILGPSAGVTTAVNSAQQTVQVGPGSCPVGSVAVGIDASKNVICATTQTIPNTSTCPTGTSYYQTSGSAVICVDNNGWDQIGSICPVSQYLMSYSQSGSIQCGGPSSPSSSGSNPPSPLTCPSGQYVSGIDGNGHGICSPLPASSPAALVCPAGQYLFDLQGSTPDCRTPSWTGGVQQTCPTGTYALGWSGAQLLCQQIQFTTGQTTSCPSGQILLSYASGGQPVCSTPPNPDISDACPTGYFATGTNGSGAVTCQIAGSTPAPSCPAGQFVIGLNNGQVICSAVSVNHLTGTCPASSYPIGVSNGALVCSGFSVILPGPHMGHGPGQHVCVPGSASVCAIPGGLGLQTCDAGGMSQSACIAVSCSSGYLLSSGTCQAVSCIPGSSQACQIPNGSGTQYCGTSGTWGACQAITCGPGFVMNGGQCQPATCQPGTIQACSVGVAYGFQSCNVAGSGYNACVITSCQTGYTLQGQTCVDTTPPRISFSVRPSNPTAGGNATIAFAVIDHESGVASFTCTLDGAIITPCASPLSLTGLANGSHTFRVTATDNTGNSASGGTTWVADVCTSGPTQACSYGNGTGTQACQADGTYSPVCMLNSCSAGYQLNGGSCVALNCGPGYTASGNACVDNTAPMLLITSRPQDPTIGASASLQFATADQGSGIAIVQCQLDSAAAAACSSPLTLSGLSLGAHTITVTAVDAAGNSTSQMASWHNLACSPGTVMSCGLNNGQGQETCSADGSGYGACTAVSCNNGYSISGGSCADLTAPTLLITQAPTDPTIGSGVTFQFSASDAGSGLAAVMCSLDGAPASVCQSPVSLSGLAAGPHRFTITATDSSGNSTSTTQSWTIDTCAPSTMVACSIPNGQGQSTCSADGSGYGSCRASSCSAGFAIGDDGSCQPLQTVPVYRFYNPDQTEHFLTLSFVEGVSYPFYNYEGVGFSVFVGGGAGMHSLYRCFEAPNWHFVSTDPGCEGASFTTNEGAYGSVYDQPAPGLIPLYRYYSPAPYMSAGDHLATVSPSTEIFGPGGYYNEGVLGYVPQ